MKKIFIFTIFIILFLLSGCRWFADNPMFPTAKLSIEANRSWVSEDYRSVNFTIHSLNRVGAEITECSIIYRPQGGSAISTLNKTINLHLPILPPDTPMSGLYAQQEVDVEIEIFDTRVQGYFTSQGINQGKAEITFSGRDYAGHPVSFKKEVGITAFSAVIPDNITIEAFCSSVDIAVSVNILNPNRVNRVEFYINDQPAGVDSSPPFISNRVSIIDEGEGSGINGCPSSSSTPVILKNVVVTVIVHDVLGNIITKIEDFNPENCQVINDNSI